jgi:uncharacterized protein YndB with AHSA1/START domain
MTTPDIRSRTRGAIQNVIDIAADPQTVFDYCIDSRHETDWNAKLLEVVKRTDGPVGLGTRFDVRLSGTGWMATEIVAFRRPTFWAATGSSKHLDVRIGGEVAHTGDGSRLSVRTLLLPHGVLRLVLPALRKVMRRHWDDNLRAIKTSLETPFPPGGRAWHPDRQEEPASVVRRTGPAGGVRDGPALVALISHERLRSDHAKEEEPCEP